MTVACRDVEAATLARDGSPPITRTTFPTCRAHYPGGSSGCACRLLPRSRGLPQMAGGSASALSLSRPAQASLTLRPAGLLSRLKRPLSRGSSPSGYPAEPLVSYQINRQLSGWNLPPLVIRAFGAHCHEQTISPPIANSALRRTKSMLCAVYCAPDGAACGERVSVDADSGCAYHVPPLLSFRRHKSGCFLRRAGLRLGAELVEALRHVL
jgi:hypothetical protein